MGNIETQPQLPDKKAFHILDYGYCRVWKRRNDQLETMEEYHLAIESEQRLKLFQNAWPLRTNHTAFVNVYHFSHNKTSNFCGQVARGSLFTQRIPYRLSEFANIKYPEIMSIMKFCIQGYSILYQHYGLFIVRSTMIGFTDSFQIKIWFHTDFSEPQPQNPNCKNIQEMFVSLISSVQSACEYLYYNCPRFSQFIVQTNYLYFSKDFNWLLKGLQIYCQKLGILAVQNLKGIKNFVKQPEGWEKFKAKKSYPKLIPTQTQIQSTKTISQPGKVFTFHQHTKIPIPESYFTKKQSIEPVTVQKANPIMSQHKRMLSSNIPGNQTSNRVLFESFAIETPRTAQNKNSIYSTKIESQFTSRPQMIRKNEIKFWKSTEKANIHQPPIDKNDKKLINSVSISRLNSPSQKISFKPICQQNYSKNAQQLRQSQSKKGSDSRSNQNFNLNGKSFDMTTDTFKRDKSVKEQFSLIQDLQVQAEHMIVPMRQLKFN